MMKILKRIILPMILLIIVCVIYIFYFNYQAGIITKGEKIPLYDNVRSALFIVDIQEATTGKVSSTNQYIQKSEALINKINEIVKYADAKNILIIYIYTETSNWFMNLLNDKMRKGNFGTKLDSRLKILSKNIFSKEKLDSFSNPELDNILLKNKISKIYFVGLDPAYCINNTISAAQSRGYKPYVIEDAIISETEELKKEMLQKYKPNGVGIIKASEYIQNISR